MSDKAKQLTEELYKLTREITVLNSCQAILDWDERTYMPPNGSENRANQAALLAGMVHDKFTSPHIGEIINDLVYAGVDPEADSFDSANLREIKRAYDKAVKVPKSLVEELSRTITLGQRAWQEAREKSDFPAFQPWMEKIVKLKRQQAEAVGYLLESPIFRIEDYERMCPGTHRRTLQRDIKGLIEKGVLKAEGSARAIHYKLKIKGIG